MVIKEIVVSRISREPSGEPIRCPEALNIPSQLLRTPRVYSKGEYSSDQQKKDVLHDALGLWGVNAEDGLSYERSLRSEW
ncbi:hypothetical protein E7W39_04520 [Cronobacter sakazakii]|uniref:hypothetical protein n=1 Tax=Cronobacter sp. HA18006 TaxID=2715229 RepID=UPI0004A88D5D|nr:hypothetical protein [Cronobacter sakazakii]NHW97938.1 hypothetical protein [Cronobacter sp. HA18006]EGT5185114.1 hypothetical protein [Cronobacter sakazakii]EGT5206972.1 hypothetical protein [Cronobacter sakazakii]EGT5653235.1 hypothetical protein [Cronobacter sakazakii]EGT5749605.1 hypothetical protein [Cronobacter sakazakii]